LVRLVAGTSVEKWPSPIWWHINFARERRDKTFAKRGLMKLTDSHHGERSGDEPAFAFRRAAIGRPTIMITCLPYQDIAGLQAIARQ
jgi:hypothetical protein